MENAPIIAKDTFLQVYLSNDRWNSNEYALKTPISHLVPQRMRRCADLTHPLGSL
ncbi:MAG: hypothetical protein K0R57_2039 [Paenibacillaceae bacterium]|jgi:hypothetical protein|nr:hypothetical protein [Paenibacillaceae bacterium]